MENGSELSLTPNPPPPAAAASGEVRPKRDFLLHLESYLSRRDGVDKLLKISRYAAKIALAAPHPPPSSLSPRLKAFESSVGLSRKAFRLGKFVQDVNALRTAARSSSSSPDLLLSAVAYGGEGIYYFIEQLVWLSKAGLTSPAHARSLSKISAWAELVGYAGSVALKARELRKIRSALELLIGAAKSAGDEKEGEIRRLREKLLLKQLSLVQDVADGMMAMADVRDGKGFFTDPLLLASAGLVSALISTHKNWTSC